MIPFISGGAGWALSALVNNQCGQLAAALEVTQYNGEGYAEVRHGRPAGSRAQAAAVCSWV